MLNINLMFNPPGIWQYCGGGVFVVVVVVIAIITYHYYLCDTANN